MADPSTPPPQPDPPAPSSRALGRERACEGLLRTDFGLVAGGAGQAALERLRRRRKVMLLGPLAAVAAVMLVAVGLWFQAESPGLKIEAGQVSDGKHSVARLAFGQEYRAESASARIEAPGGGWLELEQGSAFRVTGDGSVELVAGEAVGRLVKVELRAGLLQLKAQGATLALMRRAEPGVDEAAVVALSGSVRLTAGATEVELQPGQAATSGWGLGTSPVALAELKEKLDQQRASLAPRALTTKYHGIVGEYTQRLAALRQELATLPRGGESARLLQERIESLADCQAAHQHRLLGLDADTAQHAHLDRRLAFLERAERVGRLKSLSAVSTPDCRGAGGQVVDVPLQISGQIGLSLLGQ